MEFTCQRCGEAISTEAAFCPHCAAPQLRWNESDQENHAQSPAGSGTAESAETAESRRIHWKSAVRISLLTALVTGIVIALLSPGILLWVACGTAATMLLYRRRYPQQLLDGRLGARIGTLFGLFTATILTATDAAVMFYARYVLHQGSSFDQAYNTMLDQVAARAPTAPGAAAQWNALMHFWHSPEARAGLFLVSAMLLAIVVIMLASAAGALTARFSARHQPRGSNA